MLNIVKRDKKKRNVIDDSDEKLALSKIFNIVKEERGSGSILSF